MMRVLGVIPARGGSKGVPRKNIRLLCGKPLIQYTAEAALAAHSLVRVVVSTEDKEITAIARSCGLDVPFLRPQELAQDTTPTLPVIQHVVHWLEERDDYYDAICVLQPTSPLRTADDIDRCIELLENTGADSVVSTLPVPFDYNPHWVYFQDNRGFLNLCTGEEEPISRRQSLPPAFHREGSIFLALRNVIMEQNSLYGKHIVGYPMDPSRNVQIDTANDLREAETILQS